MQTPIETRETATHEFRIINNHYRMGEFVVEFQPLNPKTCKPWQASHRITKGADVEPPGWEGRPNAYSTLELARDALVWQIDRFAKRIPELRGAAGV